MFFHIKLILLLKDLTTFQNQRLINPLASPNAGAPALKYGDVKTVTPSPGEVKGLNKFKYKVLLNNYMMVQAFANVNAGYVN